ncbi:hypothetical protein Gogos_017355 [Gossypium gossypioides]|uniref:Uncharacterized protein n=1 Tax=Gossypium gossypioides TaxID=34282 RepID=A0A7J9BAH4_GOSGO|nr:hypothetical protein [Gossypium gossypioides]
MIVFESPLIVTDRRPSEIPSLIACRQVNASARNGDETLE